MGVALVVLLLGIACTGDDDHEPSAEEQSDLYAFASQRLPNKLLKEAAPPGFNVVQVVRHDLDDDKGRNWVTVGARMDGPVYFARAIIYVLPDKESAVTLSSRQVDITERRYELEVDFRPASAKKAPAPFDIELDELTGRCGPRFDGLFWCHAQKGRLYLLVQSTAGARADPTRITRQQAGHARELTLAYMELL
jgi:hypothetical protein